MASSNFEHRVDNLPFNIKALEIQVFLANKFGASKVRIPKKEVKQTISGEETVEFDLLVAEDGSTVKANITIKPSDSGSGKGPSLTYSADFSDLSPSEKSEAIEKFNQLIIENQLRFWPAGKAFNLISSGPNAKEADKMMKEQLLLPKNLSRFQEKGIKVSLNHEVIIPQKNENMLEESPRKPKPWDVPKAPRIKPRDP